MIMEQQIEDWLRDNGIVQLNRMPATDLDGIVHSEQFSIVVGNNRYFGATILEALDRVV
jgi:hypothetical protein